jgi:hypothetical protein
MDTNAEGYVPTNTKSTIDNMSASGSSTGILSQTNGSNICCPAYYEGDASANGAFSWPGATDDSGTIVFSTQGGAWGCNTALPRPGNCTYCGNDCYVSGQVAFKFGTPYSSQPSSVTLTPLNSAASSLDANSSVVAVWAGVVNNLGSYTYLTIAWQDNAQVYTGAAFHYQVNP